MPARGAARHQVMKERQAERLAMIGLHAIPGLGLQRLEALLRLAGCAQAAAEDLAKWGRQMRPRWNQQVSAQEVRERGEQQLEQAAKHAAIILCRGEPSYPTVLEHLKHPPPVLHAAGDLQRLPTSESSSSPTENVRRISMIGARGCTPYGKEQVRRFAHHFAWAGAVVVSGAARGIDLLGLSAALEVQGQVIAVLGSSLDCPYPTEAIPVLDYAAANQSLVLSEFPFGTSPRPGHFPRRNRLIAALGECTVVVQATCKSGTMNTVDWCMQLDREVFAVPGPLQDHACSGTNQLIADGAQVALSPEHVLAQLEQGLLPEEMADRPPVYQALQEQDLNLAQLVRQSGLTMAQVQDQVLELELKGLVVRLADGRYHPCGPRTGQSPLPPGSQA